MRHQLVELGEERVGIVGSGGGLGVVLDAEDGQLLMAQALDGVVVEVELGDDRAAFFDFLRGGGKTVVLRGDGDVAGLVILDRLVAAAMAELELEGLGAKGVRDDLVAEADAEGRVLFDQLADGFVGVSDGGGVTRAVAEEYRVGLQRLDVIGAGGGGDDVDVETVVVQAFEDGALGPEIEGGDLKDFLRTVEAAQGGAVDGKGLADAAVGVEVIRFLAGNCLDVVHADQPGPIPGLLDGFFVGNVFGAQAGLHGTVDAEALGDGARVDPGEAGDAVLFQVLGQGRDAAPVTGDGGKVADDEGGDLGAVGFLVVRRDAVIADLRGRHGDDLRVIGRVGQDFLVARHGSVENRLAHDRFSRAEGHAPVDAAVLQGENPSA